MVEFIINTQKVAAVGGSEMGAVLLDKICFYCKLNRNKPDHIIDGESYVYYTAKDFELAFEGYWKEDSIRKNLAKLAEDGFIKRVQKNKKDKNMTYWYTPTLKGWNVNNNVAIDNNDEFLKKLEQSQAEKSNHLEPSLNDGCNRHSTTVETVNQGHLLEPALSDGCSSYTVKTNKDNTVKTPPNPQ